jgi:DNA-binding SARP family transcriptional activator
MLEIRLFGTGQASYNDQLVQDFPNQQPFLLFCYLLIHKGYPHHREHLSTLFWGDSSTQTARKRLRNALWRLRKLFESVGMNIDDYFLIADDTLSFITTSTYWLDIEVFQKGIETCKDLTGRDLSSSQVERLENAVDLFIGDLLESSYEDWLLYDRERYQMDYLNALNKLMIYHGINGNYERGLAYGDSILEIDSTREKVHRQMMWLYSLAGNRNAAISQYKRCREILREELGILPMIETQNIYALLLRNEYHPKSWTDTPEHSLVGGLLADHSVNKLVKRALEKLNRLQEEIEGTSVELQMIELLITKRLSQTSRQTKKPGE